MKTKKRFAVAFVVAFVFAGCAVVPARQLGPNEFVFEFYSEPSGAMVYWGDAKAISVAPYASTFNVDPRQVAQDVVRQKFIVVWASGAKLETVRTWSPKKNKKWKFTFSRPVNAPGLNVDLQQAANQQAALAQQQAARAQQEELAAQDRRAALREILDGLNQGINSRRSTNSDLYPFKPTINCESRDTGIGQMRGTIITTCQ